jgi:pilus assembly protein CpaB
VARPIASTVAASNRNKAMLMLAIVLGIASFALMFAFLSSRDSGDSDVERALSGPGAEEVVVATRLIQAGEKITADALTVESVPGAALLEGRFADPIALEGQVATSPIFPGEQVTLNRITNTAGASTLAYKVPDGLRAVSLEVPHESWIAGGLPQPGDRVDVVAIATLVKIDPLTGEERPDLLGAFVAQNVEILAVAQTLVQSVTAVTDSGTGTGTQANPSATPADPNAPTDPSVLDTSGATVQDTGETFQTAISVTLALTPELAAKIAMLDAVKDDTAQYRLVVRQKGDTTEITGAASWSWEDLFPAN